MKKRRQQKKRNHAPRPPAKRRLGVLILLVAVGLAAGIFTIIFLFDGEGTNSSGSVRNGVVSQSSGRPAGSASVVTPKKSDSPVPAQVELLDISSLLTGPRDDAGAASENAKSTGTQQQSMIFWDGVPETQKEAALLPHMVSNIRKSDYAGAESCKECHAENYENWMNHSHRLMNALATDETVVGDFSGNTKMDYLGGQVTFFMKEGERYMNLQRDNLERTYRITRTIGSRFTQYYIGLLEKGPEAEDHATRTTDHVLPIGWWIDRQEWVPVVHVDLEGPDGTRWDAFTDVSDIPYDRSCSACHTTPAMGDWLLDPTGIKKMAFYAHVPVAFDAEEYLEDMHPTLLDRTEAKTLLESEDKLKIVRHFRDMDAVEHAMNLGISCESCHNGAQEHVKASDKNKSAVLPHFFPAGKSFHVSGDDPQFAFGRNKQTVNFICARCHSGGRPHFAAGIATWNSVEFSDAEAGYCYIRKRNSHADLEILSCVDCHEPHKPIGFEWSKTPEEDDATCLTCHETYTDSKVRFRHTRHAGGTEGDRCMNCHMPRMNEGLQYVVRTHTIFNPTWPSMIEANQPNACNLCHLDKSIDWTTKWLSRWYKVNRYDSYKDELLNKNYPDRDGPVGLGWLKSEHEPTRLVATDAVARQNATWAIPEMINLLDDPYLLNRQFTMTALEKMLGIRLENLGYRYYMTPEERKEPIKKIREVILKEASLD